MFTWVDLVRFFWDMHKYSGVQGGLRGVGGVTTPRPCWHSPVESDFVKSFNTRGTRIFFFFFPFPTRQPPVADPAMGLKASLAVLLLHSETGIARSSEWWSVKKHSLPRLLCRSLSLHLTCRKKTKNMVMSPLCLFSLLSFLSLSFPVLQRAVVNCHRSCTGRRVGPSVTLLRSLAHVPASALVISQSI